MRTLYGMVLGALLLGVGLYIHDSMQTTTGGQVAQVNQLVNWEVAKADVKADWNALVDRAQKGWVRISSE